MIKNAIVAIALICVSTTIYAQDVPENTPERGRTNFYLGLQANQLIKEVFNFSSSSSAVNNPFLLSLGINGPSGWGANFGIGLSLNQFETENDTDIRKTTSNSFNFRIGFEKKWNIGKKIGASAGVDMLFSKSKSETKSEFVGGGSSSASTSKSDVIGGGIGPRITLNYSITDRILIGTESTYYFITSKSDNTFNSGVITNPSESTAKSKTLIFNAPVVLFLMYRF